MIPYSTQHIDQEDIQAVTEALQKEYLTSGTTVNEFEEKVDQYVGAKYAVAVSSGTAALHAACAAAGIQEDDEVITTPITWVSSANAAFYCGGRPVFADIDPETYNSPDEIEKKITKHTKAIIPVHYAGQPCDMANTHEIAQAHGLTVIEDAAHAIGAIYKGCKIGALSDMTIFSFHPVKQITTCEGGMVCTNNKELYEKLKLFRAYGMVKSQTTMEQEGPWFSDEMSLGYNYRLSDVQCALGISQMRKIDKLIERRREIARIYDFEFQNVEGIVVPKQSPDGISAYHLYPIQVDADKRKDLYMQFREAGIGVGVHYYPVYKNTYYQVSGYKDICCKISEQFYERELSLPVHYKVTDDEVDYIVETTKKLLA